MHSFPEPTYINSSSIQSSHGNFETIPQLPYQIRGWNFTVFKYNSSSGLGVPSNLQTIKKKIEYFEKILQENFFLMNFVILNHLGLRILKTHFYFTKYKMNFEKHPLKTHHHKELSPLSNLFRFHKEELFLTSRHQTFFSFLPKANPGDPFSTSIQEIPLGPCSPVLHITTYTSVSPPPLIKACQQRLTFRTFFVQKKLTIQIMH